MRRRTVWAVAFLLSAALLCGCTFHDSGGNDHPAPGPTTFSSDQELETYLKQQFARSLVPGYLADVDLADGVLETSGDVTGAPSGGNTAGGGGDNGGYSGTNVQEEGVDEADKVKTDGSTLYVAGDGAVHVVGTKPDSSLTALSRIAVDGRVDSLYLRGTLLVVLYTPTAGGGGYWGGVEPALPDLMVGIPYWLPVAAQTGVLLVDVTDPEQPLPLRDWTFDGNLVSSRLIDSRLHLIQQFFPDLPPIAVHYGAEEDREATVQANVPRLDPVPLDDLVPGYAVRDGDGELLSEGRLVTSDDFLRPPEPSGGSIVAVVSLDLDTPEAPHRSVGVVLDAHHVYASTNTLYLAAQRWQASEASELWHGGEVHTAVHGFDLTGAVVA